MLMQARDSISQNLKSINITIHLLGGGRNDSLPPLADIFRIKTDRVAG
jgi:soluble P-type ATPase